MRLISGKRPSAAMIVAIFAVALGLGGSAVAGSGVLTKKQVKTVSNKQITKRAPGLAVASAQRANTAKSADVAKSAETARNADTARSADTARTADTAKSADTAGRATNIHAANVNGDGTLLGSVPSGVTSRQFATGGYIVAFTRPVAGCLISSSLASNQNAARPGSTDVVPASTLDNPNAVFVATFDREGVDQSRDFYVQMVCP
jgi:hypothetical protein